MSAPINIPPRAGGEGQNDDNREDYFQQDAGYSTSADLMTPGLSSSADMPTPIFGPSTPSTPGVLTRNGSLSNISDINDEYSDPLPPLDRLTVFDFLENLALPQRFERLQNRLSAQTERVRRQQKKLRDSSKAAKDKVVEEWRRRVPGPEEKLKRYRRRMGDSLDKFNKRWNNAKTVTLREKISFIAGVLNIFISGYLVGAWPEWFHIWYTAQLLYYYPIRWITYHRKGLHYFLADLCYFVNMLLCLSIWAFPQSKRLVISTFCLAFGNNAVAIVMWRNSLVFHSMDKVVSLFIHIMPCVTLHVLVHLIPESFQKERFPAIYTIKQSDSSSPEHYSLIGMAMWASLPYGIWQLLYHIFITVRRAESIAAGRQTSFTWLRRSYSKTWIGKFVLRQPAWLQEPTFMMIQYLYALLTMAPTPLWFWNRWASVGFLFFVFTWSIYNGATYYIDVFGVRFQKELEQLKRDMAKWQLSPELMAKSPAQTPRMETVLAGASNEGLMDLTLGGAALDTPTDGARPMAPGHSRNDSSISVMDLKADYRSTGVDAPPPDGEARERVAH